MAMVKYKVCLHYFSHSQSRCGGFAGTGAGTVFRILLLSVFSSSLHWRAICADCTLYRLLLLKAFDIIFTLKCIRYCTMPSTRYKTLRSERSRNRSSSEGQQLETTQSRNLRSSKDDEIEVEEQDNDRESEKLSATQETESSTVITTREQSSNGSRADSGNNKKKISPQNDPKTASWEDQVFDFLVNNQTGMLDEDEVVSRMNRMLRTATQQFDSARSIMTAVNDGIIFDSCCEEAQNQAVIDDLLKEVFGSLTSLDRHAISWIKRTVGASGRRQKSKHGLLLGNTKRRLTRGMAKTPAGSKNEDVLFDALREIEREKDTLRRNERRHSISSYNADDEGNRHKAVRHKRRANGVHSVRRRYPVGIKLFTILTLLSTGRTF